MPDRIITSTFRADNRWLILYGDRLIGTMTEPKDALAFGIQIVKSERNVRFVSPSGIKLDEMALNVLVNS
jgi:hypothetical protein